MADTTALKNRIRAAIKANDNQEITGPVLQQTLLDIVDELDLYPELNEEAQTRQSADTQLNNLITGIKNNIDNGYVYAGIATPSTNPVSGKVFYVAVQAGTYTNFGGVAVTEGITILKYNGASWVKEQVLFTDGGVFDISAYYATDGTLATYTDLSAALDSNNGGGVPQSLQKGGMSVKFVRTSDNKYVQYRLMSDTFNTTPANWQGVDDEPTAGSDNLVKSGGIITWLDGKPFPTTSAYEETNNMDLGLSDENGNVVCKFENGHIKTKNFDSENISDSGVEVLYDDSQANLNIGDPQGNVIVEFKDGHIRTKNFDSRNAAKSYPMDMTSAYKSAADTLIAKVKNLQSAIDKQCVTFALCTDCHYNGTQAECIRMLSVMEYICSQVNIKFVGNLGDVTTNSDSSYASFYAELIKHSYAYVTVPGNHDSYKPSVQRRTMTQMSDVHFAPKSAACYFDDHLHSVRFICFNTHEKGSDLASNTAINTYDWSGFGYSQFNWLANEALKTTYKVVLLSHTGFVKTVHNWSCTPHSNYTSVKTLIDAFVDGTSGTIQLTLESDEVGAETSITYDFSNQGTGNIVLFHGHIHGDFPLDDAENTYSKWLEIWVDNALCDNTVYEGHNNTKTINTPTEIAFDVVTIDVTNNVIYCHRFGAGADRILTFI